MRALSCPQKTELYDRTKSRFDVLFSKYNEDFTKNIKRLLTMNNWFFNKKDIIDVTEYTIDKCLNFFLNQVGS